MPPWKKVKLGDAVEIIKDTYQPSDKDDFDYIGLEHIEQQSLRLNSIGKSINISSGKFKFKTGDILFGKLRPYFRKVVIPNFPGVCSTDIWVIRAKEGFDQKFLFYLLASETFIEMSSSGSTGTRMPRADWALLKTTEWILPDLPTQSRIASILSAFDNKIELNRQMNNTLEQMAQALFKKYFVIDIYPDNLPEGWRWGKLEEIIEISKTSICPSNFPDKIFLHHSIPAFDVNKMASKETGLSILSNKFIVKSNSILFSKLNPRFPRVWMIGNINESTSICSTEFLVIKPKLGYWYSFIYQTLCFKILTDSLTSIATGTSGSHQRIKPDDILKTEIFIPSEYDGIQFESNVRPFLKRIIKNNIENEILTIMRDNLLPKLMDGELPVDSVSLEESRKTIVA